MSLDNFWKRSFQTYWKRQLQQFFFIYIFWERETFRRDFHFWDSIFKPCLEKHPDFLDEACQWLLWELPNTGEEAAQEGGPRRMPFGWVPGTGLQAAGGLVPCCSCSACRSQISSALHRPSPQSSHQLSEDGETQQRHSGEEWERIRRREKEVNKQKK